MRELQHRVQILAHIGQWGAWRGGREHLLPARAEAFPELQHGTVGNAVPDDLPQYVRRNAAGHAQCESLQQRHDVHAHDELMRELGSLAGADVARARNDVRERVEYRPGAGERDFRAAYHQAQLAFVGGKVTAGDGHIDGCAAFGLKRVGDGAHGRGAERAAGGEECFRSDRLQYAARAEHDVVGLRAIQHEADDDVTAAGDVRGRSARGCTSLLQCGNRFVAHVVHEHAEPGRDEALSYRLADNAKPDHTDVQYHGGSFM